MRNDEIVDVDVDPRETRRARWRRFRRFAIPIGAVVLIVCAIAGIAVYDYQSNRRGILLLGKGLIRALEHQARGDVTAYLQQADSAVKTAASLPEVLFTKDGRNDMERLGRSFLLNRPQFAMFYVGYPNGDFLMVVGNDDGSADTKFIDHVNDERRVTWKRRDAQGDVVAVENDPDDTYDPRVRPWYQGALTAKGVSWTDAYVFYTSRKPGITVSLPVYGDHGELLAVIGLDIFLDALSKFLADLDVGANGTAMILDGDGRLVAYPDPQRVLTVEDGKPRQTRLPELGDPLLTEVFDRIRVAGEKRAVMEIDGTRQIVSASSLSDVVGRDWLLLLVVPENDFVGFLAANSRQTLSMASVIVALAIGLAGLLAYQGVRSDRSLRMLEDRQRRLEVQGAAFAELTDIARLDPEDDNLLSRITEAAARSLRARRVSVWRLDVSADALVCRDCFDREALGHTAGTRLLRSECSGFFETLLLGENLDIADAEDDPRAVEIYQAYLEPVGCRSLVSVPVATKAGIGGFIWIEDAPTAGERQADLGTFTAVMAAILSAILPAQGRRPWAAEVPAERVAAHRPAAAGGGGGVPQALSADAGRTALLLDDRNRHALAEVRRRGLAEGKLKATVFPHLTVLVVHISDDLAMATQTGADAQQTVIAGIVQAVQEIAGAKQLPYVKIMTDQIVAASGFDGDAAPSAMLMSDVALAVQGRCAEMFAGFGHRPPYALGLDTGPAIGSPVGFEPIAYNLWGEAVRVAATMAATAPPGSIQTTETTYNLVGDDFLLRKRGGFYLERFGEMTTYALRARL